MCGAAACNRPLTKQLQPRDASNECEPLSAVAAPSADCDVFLCLGAASTRLLSVLHRLCASVAADLSTARLQRSTVPAYLALTCQHAQQPVLILTAKPHHSTQLWADTARRWHGLRAVSGEGEREGWNDVSVQSDSTRHTVRQHGTALDIPTGERLRGI